MKIIFYANFGSPRQLLDRYKLFTPNNSGVFNNITGVSNINEADYIIFLESIPSNFNMSLLQNKKVICFPREPFGSKNWVQHNFKHGFTYDNFYHVVTNPQFIDKTYDELFDLKYSEKKLVASAVVSKKLQLSGHRKRVNFLIKLSKLYPGMIDIFGNGWKNELGISYKGKLDQYHTTKNNNNKLTKYDGLINYKYSLCLENSKLKNYFTEKFTDSILCWTIPIYWGCPNIDKYFPKDCYYSIDINNPNCFEKIETILKTPITEKNVKALKKARELVLNKYNMWSTISDL